MSPLDRLLRPKSVAIVGASADTATLTGKPLAYLEKYGFAGEVYPVNPRVERIGEHRCYADIASLPQAPAAAIVLLGASGGVAPRRRTDAATRAEHDRPRQRD